MDPYQTIRRKATLVAIAECSKGILAAKSDPQITAYLTSVGAPAGENYCMAFVYWCYRQAAAILGAPNVLLSTGRCSNFKHWAPREWFLDSGEPTLEGDIWIRGRDLGHGGIVVSMNGGSKSSVRTAEGNTHTTSDKKAAENEKNGIHPTKDWGVHIRRKRDLTDDYIIRPRLL